MRELSSYETQCVSGGVDWGMVGEGLVMIGTGIVIAASLPAVGAAAVVGGVAVGVIIGIGVATTALGAASDG